LGAWSGGTARTRLLVGAFVLGGLLLTACDSGVIEDGLAPEEPGIEEPSPEEPEETVVVPNVVGKKLANAKSALRNRDLRFTIARKASARPAGTVLRQRPAPGAEVTPGRRVRLVVAKPKPTPPPPQNCTPGYSPCLVYHGGADYDCYGGSGNGPYYTEPGVSYTVSGSDPYGLDADGDGVGCE
jgi:hypothetical protein